MLKCIILDKDGKQLDILEKHKGYRPLNGYSRGKDGHYYKVVDDPRIIFDPVEIPKKEEGERNVDDTNGIALRTYPVTTGTTSSMGQTILYSTTSTSLNNILDCFNDYGLIRKGMRAFELVTLSGPTRCKRCSVLALNRRTIYSKIVIDVWQNEVKCWYEDSVRPQPNLIVKNALKRQ